MTDYFKAITDIKKYSETGDTEALCGCISKYQITTGEALDQIVYTLLMNILTDHPKLLEDSKALSAEWAAAIRRGNNCFFGSCRNLEMIRIAVLRAIINNEENVMNVLKMAEECHFGTSGNLAVNTFSEDSEKEKFCKSVIMAANLFDNFEVLEYEAYRYAEEPETFLKYKAQWLLIRCLLDREMYSALDRLYEGCFNSDLSALVDCCDAYEYWGKDNISYIKKLYRRYISNGRILSDENERICELISESGSKYLSSCAILRNHWGAMVYTISPANIRELEALIEIGFRIDDLSALVHILCYDYDEMYELVSAIAGDSPFIYIEEMARIDLKDELIRRLFLEKNVSISIDNHWNSDNTLMFFEEIFKERWLKKLPENMPFCLTDSVRENDYLDQAIKTKSTGFDYIFKKIDFTAEQLTELVDICIKYNNFKALNTVRRRLDEKTREGSGK